MNGPFVPAELATVATGVPAYLLRQWVFRQWHPPAKRRAEWTITVACDVDTRAVVYCLPDVMKAEAATRRSRNNRHVDDKGERIA